jgi:hypothetical protein
LYCRLLSQAFSSWYFSWTNGDPHRSGFEVSHCSTFRIMCDISIIIIIIIIIIIAASFLSWAYLPTNPEFARWYPS